MTIFVVAYPLVGHSNGQALQVYRQEFDQAKAGLIRPHFTIAFAITTFPYDAVLNHTRHLVEDFQPFEILLSTVVPYTDKYSGEHLLFLCTSKGEQQLINLHKRFYDGRFVSAIQVEEAFEPHLTIANTDGVDQLDAARAATTDLRLPIYGSVDALSVIEIHDGAIIRSTDVLL